MVGQPILERALRTATLAKVWPKVNPLPRHLGLAYGMVLRGASILESMVVLERAERSDVVGILCRALYENIVTGAYLVAGEGRAIEDLQANDNYWWGRLAREIQGGLPEPYPGSASRNLSVKDLCDRADGAIREKFPAAAPDYAKSYTTYYAAESLRNARAGLTPLLGYMSLSQANQLMIEPVRRVEAEAEARFLMFSFFLLRNSCDIHYLSGAPQPEIFELLREVQAELESAAGSGGPA